MRRGHSNEGELETEVRDSHVEEDLRSVQFEMDCAWLALTCGLVSKASRAASRAALPGVWLGSAGLGEECSKAATAARFVEEASRDSEEVHGDAEGDAEDCSSGMGGSLKVGL